MFGCLHPTCMEMFVMSGFVRHWLPKYSPCSFKKLFDLLGCFTLDSFFQCLVAFRTSFPCEVWLQRCGNSNPALGWLHWHYGSLPHLILTSADGLDHFIWCCWKKWQGMKRRWAHQTVWYLAYLLYNIHIYFIYMIIYVQTVSVEHLKNLANASNSLRSFLASNSQLGGSSAWLDSRAAERRSVNHPGNVKP